MDFRSYEAKVKENLRVLIEYGRLAEARELIEEYKQLVKEDIELYSIEAVLAIMENRIQDAEQILLAGLSIDCCNFDLLYNLAYLCQQTGNLKKAEFLYQQAQKVAPTELRGSISDLIRQIADDPQYAQTTLPITSIVILTYNNLNYNKLCIESIRKYTEPGTYEIIVVDNNSTDGTVEWLKEQPDLTLILNDRNLGFPKGCNQGMEIARGDSILLLNNDTIVTPRWLSNLRTCLFSDAKVGAVGAVTNSCSNLQAIRCSYQNIDDMLAFAEQYNRLDPAKWEERLRLVGFCLLIKQEVVRRIGLLDERFTPGNFEDDDYSFRIRQAGYSLLLCKDTFIHHFGSGSFGKEKEKYNCLLRLNREKFIKKWGFDAYQAAEIRRDLSLIIAGGTNQAPRVLHVNCAAGGTLLDIKNMLPMAKVSGIEQNDKMVIHGNPDLNIRIGDPAVLLDGLPEGVFDYIAVTASKSKEIIDLASRLEACLAARGTLFVCCPESERNSIRNFLLANTSTLRDSSNTAVEATSVLRLNKASAPASALKYNDLQDNSNWLFDGIDLEYAAMIMEQSAAKIEEMVAAAERSSRQGKWENMARIIMMAADYGHHNHPGYFSSAKLEALLLQAAQAIDIQRSDHASLQSFGAFSQKRYLHVLSQGYATGGHTRLAERMICHLAGDGRHSLAITIDSRTTPPGLLAAVAASGGSYYTLDRNSPELIERARLLRRLARDEADAVILHVHPHDPIPALAFGVEGGAPVMLVNHADHAFWLNVSIVDTVADIRPAGQVCSLRRRKAYRSALLPIPLGPIGAVPDKCAARAQLGIDDDALVLLSVASAYKFMAAGGCDYMRVARNLAGLDGKILLLVVGPQDAGHWKALREETGGRVRALGLQPDVKQYYAAADIFLDSFTIGSLTSALEAGMHGLPVVGLQSMLLPLLQTSDISLDAAGVGKENPDEYMGGIRELLKDKTLRAEAGAQLAGIIRRDHQDEWSDYFRSAEALLNGTHRVQARQRMDTGKEPMDLFWSYFQKTSGLSNNRFQSYTIQ
ncbi:MAG: glycosyltransferase [Negativicutes bacterium]|nr:glycosyltransferase [Negativicutes bacterium]